MITLPEHTQKMREKFKVQLGKFRPVTSGATNDILDELDAIIRETLAWAEKEVDMGEKDGAPDAGKFAIGWNRCREEMITRFKEIQGL